MRLQQINTINALRIQGQTPTQIARATGISINTVKSHIRRHPDIPGTVRCQCCGRPVLQTLGKKKKLFCDARCRSRFWNSTYREKQDEKQSRQVFSGEHNQLSSGSRGYEQHGKNGPIGSGTQT